MKSLPRFTSLALILLLTPGFALWVHRSEMTHLWWVVFGTAIFSLLFYGSAVVLYHVWGWLREHRHQLTQKLTRSPLEPALHGVLIFLILTNPGAPRGFIYFQF